MKSKLSKMFGNFEKTFGITSRSRKVEKIIKIEK